MKRPRKLRSRRRIAAACILLLLPLLVFYVSYNMEPVVTSICRSQAKVLATSAINSAVVNELRLSGTEYADLVSIKYDVYGAVSSIETDIVEINMLQSRLTDAVNRELSAIETRDISIPLGTLSGIQLLSGRGPAVRLRMMPASYAQSNLINQFDSAGINQTRHRIMIEFTVSMTVIVAPYRTVADVTLTVPVAETVIIGTVPESFADFGAFNQQSNGSE